MRLLDRSVFQPAPPGVLVWAFSQYTQTAGGRKVRRQMGLTRSDPLDSCDEQISEDHGRTGSNPRAIETRRADPGGTWRRHPRAGFADPVTGAYLRFDNEGVLPTDSPLEGMKAW